MGNAVERTYYRHWDAMKPLSRTQAVDIMATKSKAITFVVDTPTESRWFTGLPRAVDSQNIQPSDWESVGKYETSHIFASQAAWYQVCREIEKQTPHDEPIEEASTVKQARQRLQLAAIVALHGGVSVVPYPYFHKDSEGLLYAVDKPDSWMLETVRDYGKTVFERDMGDGVTEIKMLGSTFHFLPASPEVDEFAEE